MRETWEENLEEKKEEIFSDNPANREQKELPVGNFSKSGGNGNDDSIVGGDIPPYGSANPVVL